MPAASLWRLRTLLRSGGTLFSLQKLHDKRHLSGKEFYELTGAYEFLRHLEHRLQLRQGQQTHRLPVSGPELRIVQRAMDGHSRPAEDFTARVRQLMSSVAEIYRRVIYQQQTRGLQEERAEFQLHVVDEHSAGDHLAEQMQERLARDAPPLYEIACDTQLSPIARKNLFRFLSSALTSSERYAVVLRHAAHVHMALEMFEVSDLLTDILVRHPEEIATFAELGDLHLRSGSGYLFESPLGRGRHADPVFAYLASSEANYADKLAMLRRQFRHRVLITGAKDIAERRDVYESLSESTAAAEDAIAAALAIAEAPNDLAVLALGRLGSGEFDVLSDADVIFIGQEGSDRENSTKAASQIMQVLAAYTKEGMVFPVDARLRPHGGEGELLVTPSQLARYCEQEAHAWEALTYSKLRFVAGNRELGDRALSAAQGLFRRFSEDPAFPAAVREMRAKLEIADTPQQNFKTSPGAIYDIDFLCSFLLVKHIVPDKRGSLRDRLWKCVACGSLDRAAAAALDHAAELLRTVDHVVRLVTGRAGKWLPTAEQARGAAERLTAQILRRDFAQGLEAELEQTFLAVRAIYERVLTSSIR
jgi:[glutamine synthetase] adenylyltransferase / [glutamine synthetase]-adenylyl-L-tyrosine phosphorylase